MKIAYSWLKDYIDIDLPVDEIAAILTQTGLEVGGVEEVETIKGGLQGLVIGHVLTCVEHPNSDHLSITTVDVGGDEPLPIVCGAANVAAGQKVVVATVGATLYDGDDSFKIKRSKIRGEVSMGMICAEDEIGVGNSHDGIIELPEAAPVGQAASEYYDVKSDYVIEIDLTPNRIDGASHIGVARDLAAYLKQSGDSCYKTPSVESFKVDRSDRAISVEVLNGEACARYCGVTISGITIEESPEWLKNRLTLIGLSPINNVVDITNYVLFETGQPLHAFDTANLEGDQIEVKTVAAKTKFTTLDGVERELNDKDLMICDSKEPKCLAGVFGGLESGVKDSTVEIFLESAYFNPVSVRKSARRHGLNTDSSFRFERGVDPNNTIYALKRAAMMIKEIAGGEISSEVVEVVSDSSVFNSFDVELSYANVAKLIGEDLGAEKIKSIVSALEMEIVNESESGLSLKVPAYRVDVTREVDVIEDILRIYGFNSIKPSMSVKSTIQYSEAVDKVYLQNLISDILSANGFNEIMSNSLHKLSYYEELESFKSENSVKIFNPLSQDLNSMRQTLIFGGLEAIARNRSYKNSDLKFYEFGKVYSYDQSIKGDSPLANYFEEEHIAMWVTGDSSPESWRGGNRDKASFFTLKSHVYSVLGKLGLNPSDLRIEHAAGKDIFSDSYLYGTKKSKVVQLGIVAADQLKRFNIKDPVYYAVFNWTQILSLLGEHKVVFKPLSKYPEVRRDLALLVDNDVEFATLRNIAFKSEKNILREVDIFDVYEGDKLPAGKKSYALSFILRDDKGTLKDKQIDKIMNKLIGAYKHQVGAELR